MSASEIIHWNITEPLQDESELGFVEVMKELRRRVELFEGVMREQLGPRDGRPS